MAIPLTSQTVLPGGNVTFAFQSQAINGYNQFIYYGCGSPASGITCKATPTFSVAGFSPLNATVTVGNIAQGTYPFTVTGTSGGTSRTATGQIVVGGLTGSFSQTSATIPVGNTANINVSVNGQNGFTGSLLFDCLTPPSGVLCSFTPNGVNLQPGGVATTQLSIFVYAKPAASNSTARSDSPSRVIIADRKYWPVALLLSLALFVLPSRSSRLNKKRVALSLTLLFAVGFVACGGGTGNSATGNNNTGPRPTPNPTATPVPSVPTTVQVQVVAYSDGATAPIGTIVVTIP